MEVPGALLLALALVAMPLTTMAPASAHSTSSTLVTDSGTLIGDDTYIFRLEATPSTEDFEILEGSYISVKGEYDPGTPNSCQSVLMTTRPVDLSRTSCLSFDAPRQEAGAYVAILRAGAFLCGQETCFHRILAESLKDQGDARVASDPNSLSVEDDQDEVGYQAFAVSLTWDEDSTVDVFDGINEHVTFIVSIPGANALDVDVHLHVSKSLTGSSVSHDGGFMLTTGDFHSGADVDTMPAQAVVDAEASRTWTLASNEFLYFFMSAAHLGTPVIRPPETFFGPHDSFAPTLPAAARGYYGVEHPGGLTDEGTRTVLGGPSGFGTVKNDNAGTYRFFIDHHLGAGSTDVYVVGFAGEI